MEVTCKAALLLCFGIFGSPDAFADPTIEVPSTGRGVLISGPSTVESGSNQAIHGGDAALAVVAEVNILASLAAGSEAVYPEHGALDGGTIGLSLARLGVAGRGRAMAYSLRIDVSEGLRTSWSELDTEFQERPVAAIDRFIDDAAVWWTPRAWAHVVFGRFKVPFSRFRHLERTALTSGSVPFAVDRLAPDRRWGASVYGDLGGISYAAGVYGDGGVLEPNIETNHALDCTEMTTSVRFSPSSCGRVMLAGYAWWTPRAPVGGDHMATPTSDPWFAVMRPAAGLGLLWREREGHDRMDVSLAIQIAYRRLAAVAELFAYLDGDVVGASMALQGSLLVTDRSVVFATGEYDGELRNWSAGGGVSVFATRDRRNKISLRGFVRRDLNDDSNRDGVMVQVQAAL